MYLGHLVKHSGMFRESAYICFDSNNPNISTVLEQVSLSPPKKTIPLPKKNGDNRVPFNAERRH